MRNLIVVILVFSSFCVSAQSWAPVKKTEFIYIEDQIERCVSEHNGIDHENVYLKVTNLSELPLEVSFDIEYWYDDHCINCDKFTAEHRVNLQLDAGASLSGKCSDQVQQPLMIYKQNFGKGPQAKLTDYFIRNLSVSPVN